jgi:tryptophanase
MTFYDFADAVKDVLGYQYVVNVHQGRAAEHLLAFQLSGEAHDGDHHVGLLRGSHGAVDVRHA